VLTPRALLADPALELRELEPGRPGALDTEIVWVHNTELPDPSPYLRENELVLTNGLWLDSVSPAEFVANVARAGAAGIVLGLRAQAPSTPPALVEACRRAGLPLLELSISVPFTALSRAAAAGYAEQRQDVLVGMVRRGDALAGAISRGAGASGVLRVLRRDHDLPLAVVDRMGRLLASAGAELTAEQLRAVSDGLARHPPPLELELPPAGRATVFLVGAVGAVVATLLCLRPMRALTRAEREALEQAARFLSLEVAKQQAVQAIESRFAGELLDMILSGPRRSGEVRARLRAFGVDPADRLAVCALAFAGGEPATLPGLGEAVGEFFVSESIPVVVAGGSRDVVAFLPWRSGRPEPTPALRELAGRLVDSVAARFPGRRPVAGLGGLADDASGLREPLIRSREACRVLRRRADPPVAAFAELSTYHLLLGLHDPGTLRDFADGVLGPLRHHDARRGGELEGTLRAFLEHECHWANTAAALYVHVNTLRNRMARIAELTGRDVARTEDRVDLFLALAADDMA
jgi:hypothetical protein